MKSPEEMLAQIGVRQLPPAEAAPNKSAKGNGADEPPPKLVPIRFVKGEVVPPREWTVPGWVPKRKVTLLQGDGGDGKTSLVQQLQSSCATALPWLGLRVEECASVGVYTEDEEADLKERQAAINAAYNLECASTAKMHLFPMVEEEAALVAFDRAGKATLTPFYRQVLEAAMDYHAGLVTLDVAVDLFAGDEIKRREVRAFIRPLHTLARKINGSVVLTSHVSAAGIRSDGGHSGSTDWSNAVRSRLYLSRPKDDDAPADANARVLTRKKATFAGIGDTIKLHWREGVIVPDGLTSPSYFRRPVEDVFLALLDEHVAMNRRPLSDSPNASNFAPRVFESVPANERDGYRAGDLSRAMEGLFKSRRIISVSYGRSGDQRRKIARCASEEEGQK